MEMKLTFIETYSSEFKGKQYNIGVFVHYYTGQVYRSVGLDCSKLTPNTEYECFIEYSKNKFRVTKVK